MLAKAELKFTRGSGKKIRLVIDLVRGMNAKQAVAVLRFVEKGSAGTISKVVASAMANAKVKGLNADDLVISKITADDAARWKRFRPAAFGRASEILKRTSHIKVELDMAKEKKAVSDKKGQ
jgi:large subunit ribosomal protein L22